MPLCNSRLPVMYTQYITCTTIKSQHCLIQFIPGWPHIRKNFSSPHVLCIQLTSAIGNFHSQWQYNADLYRNRIATSRWSQQPSAKSNLETTSLNKLYSFSALSAYLFCCCLLTHFSRFIYYSTKSAAGTIFFPLLPSGTKCKRDSNTFLRLLVAQPVMLCF